MSKPYFYGGQAVMEGVMMRGRRSMAVACRAPDGEIVVWEDELRPGPFLQRVRPLPFIRGVFLLWDTLLLGTRSLMFSANVSLQEEDEDPEQTEDAAEPDALTGPLLWGTVAVSLLFAVGLFFVVPVAFSAFLERYISSHFLVNLLEGVIRLGLLIGYLWLIARMEDIRRVFGYHGAEHKTIHAHEKGLALNVENVRPQPLEHVRCGTGFLLLVVLISVLIFVLLGRPPLLWLVASRIVLVPVIAAIAYEVIQLAGKHTDSIWVRAILWPGLMLQRLTTREPDDGMLEVAIAAFKRVAVRDGILDPATAADGARSVDDLGNEIGVPQPAVVGGDS